MASLYLFLKDKTFSKYKNGIERISTDFINSGYEQFLCAKTLDEFYWMRKTEEKVKKYADHKTHPKILAFLDQFNALGTNEVIYIFPERMVPTFFIIQEVCKQAKQFYLIDNIYSDDETNNYAAIFDVKDTESIALMNHLTYSGYMSDVFGGYKLFNNSLPYYAEFCADGSQRYILTRPNEIMHFLNFQTRHDTNPFIIYDVRKRIEGIVSKYYTNEFELYLDLNYTLLPKLQSFYVKCVEIENSSPQSNWKTKKEEIRDDLIARKIINVKWKNEQSLFLLIKKYYPDTRYQYRPDWLSPQSIDVYIPSLNVAIEYQGIQHYEAVDYFGGKATYKHRVQLDKRKRELCQKNGVQLIEWDYNYDVSLDNLKAKLQHTN